MNPLRYDNEVDYYEILLSKYQQIEQGGLTIEQMRFEAQEMIQLMHELKTHDTTDTFDKEVMENIVKNMLILLLSLFENKDQTVNYKEYSELSIQEKQILKKQLLPITSNSYL